MPKLMDIELDQLITGSHYKFSATKIDALGASEYTLAHLVVDESGSVTGFKAELEKAMLAAKQACEASPRAENLLLRATAFSSKVRELHGFKLLKTIEDDDYIGALRLGGSTELHRATHEALEATLAYANTLAHQEFLANAIVIIITDGEEMEFDVTTGEIAELIRKGRLSEKDLEALSVVLVGITGNHVTARKLQDFQKAVGITQFIDAGDATPGKLAKLAQFVSMSISSVSGALGTGQGSQSISFAF